MTKLNLFFKYILEQPIKIIKIWTYVMFDDLSEDEDSLSIFHNLDFFAPSNPFAEDFFHWYTWYDGYLSFFKDTK